MAPGQNYNFSNSSNEGITGSLLQLPRPLAGLALAIENLNGTRNVFNSRFLTI